MTNRNGCIFELKFYHFLLFHKKRTPGTLGAREQHRGTYVKKAAAEPERSIRGGGFQKAAQFAAYFPSVKPCVQWIRRSSNIEFPPCLGADRKGYSLSSRRDPARLEINRVLDGRGIIPEASARKYLRQTASFRFRQAPSTALRMASQPKPRRARACGWSALQARCRNGRYYPRLGKAPW